MLLVGLWGFFKFSHENDAATQVKMAGNADNATLITYVYSESPSSQENLKFFLDNGLYGSADFIFIMYGPTNVTQFIPQKANIRVVSRPSSCFDLGVHGEVLRKDALWKKYNRFITLNSSIRGPFMPYWSRSCWSDAFLDHVTDEVKLVGMTASCEPKFHIQAMIWATDAVGMELLLYAKGAPADAYYDEMRTIGLGGCYKSRGQVMHGQIEATALIRSSGYQVDALMATFHKSSDHEKDCAKYSIDDMYWDEYYYGTNMHPYETIFMKVNRNVDPITLARLTKWHQPGTKNGSWGVCH